MIVGARRGGWTAPKSLGALTEGKFGYGRTPRQIRTFPVPATRCESNINVDAPMPVRHNALVVEAGAPKPFVFRILCLVLAFSLPVTVALDDVLQGTTGWVELTTSVLIVAAGLIWAVVIQRWRAPLVDTSESRRRGTDPWPVGKWQSEIPTTILDRARTWGRIVAFGCAVAAALNATQLTSASPIATAAHAASMLGALALGAFALRSRITVSGSQVQDLGVLGDQELSYQRFREVVVSRFGPLSVWAPQLDDESPRGHLVGRCARLART